MGQKVGAPARKATQAVAAAEDDFCVQIGWDPAKYHHSVFELFVGYHLVLYNLLY